jgi:hypothetical protein
MSNQERLEFEGHEVMEIACKVTGSIGDARLNRSLAPGDRVVIVAEAVVKAVNHEDKDTGLIRVQTLKVAEGFALADELDADDLIHKLRTERRRMLDDLLGTPPLEGMDDA